jgi:hypothetical protein
MGGCGECRHQAAVAAGHRAKADTGADLQNKGNRGDVDIGRIKLTTSKFCAAAVNAASVVINLMI